MYTTMFRPELAKKIATEAQAISTLANLLDVYYVKHPETETAIAVDEHQLNHYKQLGYTVISKEEAHELMFSN